MDNDASVEDEEHREDGNAVGRQDNDINMEVISEQTVQPEQAKHREEEQERTEDPQDPISDSDDESDPFGDLGDDVWDVLMPIPSAPAVGMETAPSLDAAISEEAPQASVQATSQATTDVTQSVSNIIAPSKPAPQLTIEQTAQNIEETVGKTEVAVANPGATNNEDEIRLEYLDSEPEDVPAPPRSIAETVAQSRESWRPTELSGKEIRKRRNGQVPRKTLGTPKMVAKHFDEKRQRAMALTPPPDFKSVRMSKSKDSLDKPLGIVPQPSEAVPETESHPAPSLQQGEQPDDDSPVFQMRRPAQIIREDSDDNSLEDMFGESEEEVEDVE